MSKFAVFPGRRVCFPLLYPIVRDCWSWGKTRSTRFPGKLFATRKAFPGKRVDLYYWRRQEGEYFTNDRLCLPSSLKHVTIKACHEEAGGHMGINATQQRVLRRFYFSGIHKAVEIYVGNCLPCQRKIGKAKDQRHTLFSVQEGMPFQKISIDFVGPLKRSSKGNAYLFTVKDCFSRWLEAFPIHEASAEEAVEVLQHHIFSRHGIPEQIHSDQGSQFTGELFQEICDLLRVKRTQTPAYNPKSNPVERSHRDLNSIIRALVQETNQDWEEVLPAALLALRTARNRHTGVTPFWALHGREARLPIDLVYANASERQQHKTIYGYDLHDGCKSPTLHEREDQDVY